MLLIRLWLYEFETSCTLFFRGKGVIVGGLDRGFISIYDAEKLIKGQENPIIFSKDKHTGPVTALDFNPFQVR